MFIHGSTRGWSGAAICQIQALVLGAQRKVRSSTSSQTSWSTEEDERVRNTGEDEDVLVLE